MIERDPIEERNRSRTPGGVMMNNGPYLLAYFVLLVLLTAIAKFLGINFHSEIHFLVAVCLALSSFLYLVKLLK